MMSDMVLTARLFDADMELKTTFSLVLRFNDDRFPCNAAYFRTMIYGNALGSRVHTCFVPPDQPRASPLPFVTQYVCNDMVPCATVSLSLPESDIVFGEYPALTASTAPEKTEMYPAGTVLMYARAVTPAGQADTPWFIVFKPCPVRLLRGAVPVGRVMSCVEGTTAALQDYEDAPFEATVLQYFETRCQAESCSVGAQTGTLSIFCQYYIDCREF